MGEGASLRGRCRARWGARKQGGAMQRGHPWRQGVLMQGGCKEGWGGERKEGCREGKGVPGVKGALMEGHGGAKEREGNGICGLAWGVPAAGGVQWGDTAAWGCPEGRQQGLVGMAEHPGPIGESGAPPCLLRVCCLERDSHGELWGGGLSVGVAERCLLEGQAWWAAILDQHSAVTPSVLVGTALPFTPVTSVV